MDLVALCGFVIFSGERRMGWSNPEADSVQSPVEPKYKNKCEYTKEGNVIFSWFKASNTTYGLSCLHWSFKKRAE